MIILLTCQKAIVILDSNPYFQLTLMGRLYAPPFIYILLNFRSMNLGFDLTQKGNPRASRRNYLSTFYS